MQTNKPHFASPFYYSLVALLVFAVVFVAAVFYLKPLWSEVDKLAVSRDELQSKKDSLMSELKNLEEAAKNLEQSTEVGRNLSLNAIPERFEEDRLIVDLTRVAQKNDFTINGINFGLNGATADKVKRASININVSGAFGAITGFLKSLENMERKVVVKSIAVQTGQTESGIARANFNVTAEVYYLERI